MPKIFVLRHQLAEQQARLRQSDKGEASNSPPLSSDEDTKYEAGQPSNPLHPNVSEVLPRAPPGLVIQPIPPPPTAPSTSSNLPKPTASGKNFLKILLGVKLDRS